MLVWIGVGLVEWFSSCFFCYLHNNMLPFNHSRFHANNSIIYYLTITIYIYLFNDLFIDT